LENVVPIARAIDPERTTQDELARLDAQIHDDWPEPQELTTRADPEPYPLDALPPTLRDAVIEVQGFVQAPIALVASCAVSAASLACQAQIDVRRAEKLHGPTGLFLLSIADSGERKSTLDQFFTTAIREYEKSQAEIAAPEVADHRAALEAWDSKRAGLKDKIRALAKDGKPTAPIEIDLRDLEHHKPEPPRVPRLIYGDATPEALAYGLARTWPSAAVVSSEAGGVFGSHAMGRDSLVRNLALLNILWDGGELAIDRRTAESFTVRGACLTMALQIQQGTLREFFDRAGPLVRGSGFLARFLIAWPESTQGTRIFTEAPPSWPALSAFHRRITEILSEAAPIDDAGALSPRVATLAPDAARDWIEYYNAIEAELANGGELRDLRDVASKSADNVARLAALFELFECGSDEISIEAIASARRIAAWHLSESRRFFNEVALPEDIADAIRLDRWLRSQRSPIQPERTAQQFGPVRKKDRLIAALNELAQLDRLRRRKIGKRMVIELNPKLGEQGATCH
jgi:putative DNA primase/helicase